MTITFPKKDIEQFLRTYSIMHFDVNKEETKCAFCSNLNGSFNLWGMDLPDSYPYPLTFHGQASLMVKFDPNGSFLITDADNNGDENYQIYALPPEGGNLSPLITGEKEEKYYFGELSEDGKRIYYMTSKDNPEFLNIRVRHLDSGADDLLLTGEKAATFLVSVSPDEQSLGYVKHFANTFVTGYVRRNGEDICLTPDEKNVHTVTDMTFIDDNHVLFITNYDDEFSYLASYNLKTHEFNPLLKLEKEEIRSLNWHKHSETAYLVTEKGVADYLYSYKFGDTSPIRIDTPLETIQQLKVAESGAFYLLGRSATLSFNLYKKSPEGSWHTLTKNQVPGVANEELVDPEVVTYASYDGTPIESLLFRAKPDVANGYTIFWPHGGPQHAERKFFRGAFQFLLGRGYNIFAPNFRGSTGYGASYTKLVEGDWGEGPRLDCVSGIEWLFESGITDRDKLFLMGGSFGGYMTLLLAGRHPDYFRACVDIFGPSNLFTFLESVPPHWKPMMERWLGDPIRDKERLIKDSPVTYVENMTKPMLVIQGANDPRVVKAESDNIVDALRKQGTEVEYIVFENEGHGFAKKENEIKAYRAVLEFFERYQ